MSTWEKMIKFTGITFAAGALLVGCGSGDTSESDSIAASDISTDEEVNLEVWLTPQWKGVYDATEDGADYDSFLLKAAELYEADNPNVNIEVQVIPSDQRNSKLSVALDTDSLPNVFFDSSFALSAWPHQGVALPLNDVISEESRADISETIWDNVTIGDGSLHIMAGPCSVESEEQIVQIAKDVKASGATLLRGGAFKPRTSPYAFQGLKAEGLDLLKTARRETGLPIVTEIMRASHIDMFENVDIIQVGARNMQNFELLKELGKIDKPILLKRGLSATIEEWLMSAEYIMAGGNDKVMLCERGIRTYETFTRNTLDISAIPIIKKLSHLPVIVDPSHASGKSWLVEPLAMAAVAAGADGLIIEVHNDPPHALSDGAQSLTPKQFDGVAKKVFGLKKAVDKLN